MNLTYAEKLIAKSDKRIAAIQEELDKCNEEIERLLNKDSLKHLREIKDEIE